WDYPNTDGKYNAVALLPRPATSRTDWRVSRSPCVTRNRPARPMDNMSTTSSPSTVASGVNCW
ncbi:hypothetical protein EXIGLDRAFT_735165, partial [Exidia glandulosa HHB12029]